MDYQNYKLPTEYFSLIYLHRHLGDIKVVECVCYIWNQLNQGDTLRILRTDEPYWSITLTGICRDLDSAIPVCRYLTTFGVDIKYENALQELAEK